jgi:hypothetical protein
MTRAARAVRGLYENDVPKQGLFLPCSAILRQAENLVFRKSLFLWDFVVLLERIELCYILPYVLFLFNFISDIKCIVSHLCVAETRRTIVHIVVLGPCAQLEQRAVKTHLVCPLPNLNYYSSPAIILIDTQALARRSKVDLSSCYSRNHRDNLFENVLRDFDEKSGLVSQERNLRKAR